MGGRVGERAGAAEARRMPGRTKKDSGPVPLQAARQPIRSNKVLLLVFANSVCAAWSAVCFDWNSLTA